MLCKTLLVFFSLNFHLTECTELLNEERQQQFLQLMDGVFDLTSLPQALLDILANFDPLKALNKFPNPDTVLRYFNGARQGNYLGRDQTFNKFHHPSLIQAIELFETLFFAPDWDTFYKTAIAARDVSNPEQFFYSVLTALMHREDAIQIPPLYEIAPKMFFPSQNLKHLSKTKKCEKEEKFAKFYNDPRIKSQIMMQNMKWPSWWDSERYGKELPRREEQLWYMTNQLLNRLDMERHANGLPPLKPLDWNEFDISRDSSISKNIAEVLGYESRVQDAIKKGYMLDSLEYKMTSLNDTSGIEKLMRNILGRPNTLNPSLNDLGHQALQLLQLAAKRSHIDGFDDLINYRYYKRLDGIMRQHKALLPPYTKEELAAEGIVINNVKINNRIARNAYKRLEHNLENNRIQRQSDEAFEVAFNEPICVEFDVDSNGTTSAFARLFSVAKLPGYENQMVLYCNYSDYQPYCQDGEYFIDAATYELRLNTGNNTLQFDVRAYLGNRTDIQLGCEPHYFLKSSKNVPQVVQIEDDSYIPPSILLPTGVPFTLFFMIIPNSGGNINSQPLGFPFDRRTLNRSYLRQPNMFYQDINLIKNE